MFYNSMLHVRKSPFACARIKGSSSYPDIAGMAWFYKMQAGILVSINLRGLPEPDADCQSPIFAVHIHGGGSCTGDETDPFMNAMTHYNPDACAHPYHAGDLPPLFGANGIAFSAFLTNRFSADEIIGKTMIVHAGLDNFTTQPSGNAGKKMACGVVRCVQ